MCGNGLNLATLEHGLGEQQARRMLKERWEDAAQSAAAEHCKAHGELLGRRMLPAQSQNTHYPLQAQSG